MTDQNAIGLVLMVFRCVVGAVMLAHGINRIIGGGRIPACPGGSRRSA